MRYNWALRLSFKPCNNHDVCRNQILVLVVESRCKDTPAPVLRHDHQDQWHYCDEVMASCGMKRVKNGTVTHHLCNLLSGCQCRCANTSACIRLTTTKYENKLLYSRIHKHCVASKAKHSYSGHFSFRCNAELSFQGSTVSPSSTFACRYAAGSVEGTT